MRVFPEDSNEPSRYCYTKMDAILCSQSTNIFKRECALSLRLDEGKEGSIRPSASFLALK